MAVAAVFDKIVGFLRAGYPADAAPFGYVPLLALLPQQLPEVAAADLARPGSDALSSMRP